MTKAELERLLVEVEKEIQSWPQWKRSVCESILANKPSRKYPRFPVDQFGNVVEVTISRANASDSMG